MTAINIPVAHHCNFEAGNDTAATLLAVFGSIRQLLHHANYLPGGSGVFLLLKAARQVTEVTGRLGGHQANDLIRQLVRGQLPLGKLDAALYMIQHQYQVKYIYITLSCIPLHVCTCCRGYEVFMTHCLGEYMC